MTETILNISGRRCHIIESDDSSEACCAIVKPLGEFERICLMDECKKIQTLTDVPFVMLAFEVTEHDLRIEGRENTFDYLTDNILPYIYENYNNLPLILGGYSLGGLFAIWSSTLTDAFTAVMAGSPSLWVDGWEEYATVCPPRIKKIYMSLGKKEECTKKLPYRIIGDRIRWQHELNIRRMGKNNCTLIWHEGGHFSNIEERKAQGFAWCIEEIAMMVAK